MDIRNVIKMIMKEQGFTYELMGQKMDGKSRQQIADRLNRPVTMNLSTLFKFLDVLDCDLVIRSRRKGHEEWVATPIEVKGKGEE